MKSNSIKAVVIGALSFKDSTDEGPLIYLGAYENLDEAYGRALLHINQAAADYPEIDEKDKRITPLYELEADQGWGMSLHIEGSNLIDHALIFIDDDNV